MYPSKPQKCPQCTTAFHQKTNHTLKSAYTHPPLTNHPSSNCKSLLSILHAGPNQQHYVSVLPTNKIHTNIIHQTTEPFNLPSVPVCLNPTNPHSLVRRILTFITPKSTSPTKPIKHTNHANATHRTKNTT